MTHLIFFSVEPTPEGGITGMDRFPPADVLAAARGHGCELIICFGGNGRSSGFSAMTRSPDARKAFVKKVKQLVKRFKLDGVDYNWVRRRKGRGRGGSNMMLLSYLMNTLCLTVFCTSASFI